MSTALPSYGEAAAVVAVYAARLGRRKPAAERAGLDQISGRVLARRLRADRDQPPFSRSARDGYACRAREASTHLPLPVAGSTRAGEVPGGPLPKGAAWEIMTGAAVPPGADAVVMLEHVKAAGGRIRLLPPRTVKKSENIVAKGAQARKGDELLAPGTAIAAPQVALAAACGYTTLEVFARPRVAILPTGDEIVPVESLPAPGQIRNSNGPMLAAMAAAAGGEPWLMPAAADNAQALDGALSEASGADLLLITGGVSAGKFDLVEPALARAGARFYFTGARIQPGKPAVFADLPFSRRSRAGKARRPLRPLPVFGLPGNPVSSAVTFLLFAAPVVAALAGRAELGPRFALARLAADAKTKPDLTRFLPASCTFAAPAGQLPEVAPVSWEGSGDLAALARSNCFLVLPEASRPLKAGAIVRILLP